MRERRRTSLMRVTLEQVVRHVLPSVEKGGVLSAAERSTLVQLAEVLVEPAALGLTAGDIASNVEAFLRAGRSRRTWRVRVLLRLIELSPLPRFRRPFSRLSPSERKTLISEDWIGGGRIGRICGKSKNLIVLGAYGDPRVEAKTGYVPLQRRRRFAQREERDAALPSA
jgi:hypothetical protein